MNPALVTAGVVSSAVAGMAWMVRAPSCHLLAPGFHRGVRTRKAIALTFDDGPSESTPELLDVLAAHGVRATFFQCGVNVRRLPAIARRVADAGHCIGNHSTSHAMLSLHSARFIYAELAETQKIITGATGREPRYFRPPYGVRWFGMRAALQQLDLTSVFWTAIGRDWNRPADLVAQRLLRGASNGAIFCLHDGRELTEQPDISSTVQAVGRVIPVLLEQGYKFETIDQIICPTS